MGFVDCRCYSQHFRRVRSISGLQKNEGEERTQESLDDVRKS